MFSCSLATLTVLVFLLFRSVSFDSSSRYYFTYWTLMCFFSSWAGASPKLNQSQPSKFSLSYVNYTVCPLLQRGANQSSPPVGLTLSFPWEGSWSCVVMTMPRHLAPRPGWGGSGRGLAGWRERWRKTERLMSRCQQFRPTTWVVMCVSTTARWNTGPSMFMSKVSCWWWQKRFVFVHARPWKYQMNPNRPLSFISSDPQNVFQRTIVNVILVRAGENCTIPCIVTDPEVTQLALETCDGRPLPSSMSYHGNLQRGIIISNVRKEYEGCYECVGQLGGIKVTSMKYTVDVRLGK